MALSLLHPKFLSLIPLRMYRVVLSSAQCRWGQSRTLFKRWRHPPQDLPGSSSITDSRHHAHLGRELQTGEKGGQAGERVSANHSRPWINIRYIPRGSDIANARMPDKRSNQVTHRLPPSPIPLCPSPPQGIFNDRRYSACSDDRQHRALEILLPGPRSWQGPSSRDRE